MAMTSNETAKRNTGTQSPRRSSETCQATHRETKSNFDQPIKNEELKEIQLDLQLGTNTIINLTNNRATWRTEVVRSASAVPTNGGNAF